MFAEVPQPHIQNSNDESKDILQLCLLLFSLSL